MNLKKALLVLLAVVVLIGGSGFSALPAKPANVACTAWHTVYPGQSLSWIGAYYGVSWVWLAQINNIVRPYVIRPGQSVCVRTWGGTAGTVTAPAANSWSFQVLQVEKNTKVTVRTYGVPSNVMYTVEMGQRGSDGKVTWTDAGKLDSGRGGSVKAFFDIPATYKGIHTLAVRLTQAKKLTKRVVWFNNTTGGSSAIGYNYGYGTKYPWGVPTIHITHVVRNKTVGFRTNNYPANLKFDVYMNGLWAGSFSSKSGGSFYQEFTIPAALRGLGKITIRTQNWSMGYYSYNWFWNNTANVP